MTIAAGSLWAMSSYRRLWLPGGTYFFTATLLERDQALLVERIDDLRAAFAATRRSRPFELISIVVLPDHLHCIWRLPAGDADNGSRWRQIKSAFSRALPPGEPLNRRRIARRERGIWQPRFAEHLIRDHSDLAQHVDYVHRNPQKHNLVARVSDWQFSSFHRHVRQGLLPPDWGDAPAERAP